MGTINRSSTGFSRIGWMTGGEKARWIDEEMADVIAAQGVKFIDEHRNEPFFLFFATQDIHVPRPPLALRREERSRASR